MSSAHPFDAWLLALNTREPGHLEQAAAPDFDVDVYGVGPTREQRMKSVKGYDGFAQWLGRAPSGTTFSLASAVEADGATRIVHYRVDVLYFNGGGVWKATVGEDGRITHLEHRPDDLDKRWQVPPDTVQWEKDVSA